jgi:putative ABC transport system substrate-binding protein
MTRVLSTVILIVALLAAPVAAEADRAPRIPRIGVVYAASVSVETFRSIPVVKALLEGLAELSWVEGRDFVLDARSAKRDLDRVPELVAALVAQKVDLMLSLTCGEDFHIVRKATSTIPVIGPLCKSDLVGKGIVASLARPGGNITGISEFTPELSAKRLSLLKEVVPTLTRVAVLECGHVDVEPEWQELRAAAAALAVTLHSVQVGGPAAVPEPVFDHLIARQKADGLLGLSNRPECFARLPAGPASQTSTRFGRCWRWVG